MNSKLEQLKAYLTPLTLEQARAGLDGSPLPEVLSGEFVYALELDFRDELEELARDYLLRKARDYLDNPTGFRPIRKPNKPNAVILLPNCRRTAVE